MKLLNENKVLEKESSLVKDYRKYALEEDGAMLDKNHLDDWAVRRACRIHNCSEDKLLSDIDDSYLTEDTTLGDAAEQAMRDIDNEKVVKSAGQIESALD